MIERFLKWLFMSDSEDELVTPFSDADMKTRDGIARLTD